MILLKIAYEKINKRPAPYYYDYSIFKLMGKPIRKWVANVVAPNCVFNKTRIFLYRLCGFKIGKRCFIGMHCYFDDLCYKSLQIGDDVVISYGGYFALHGKSQGKGNHPVVIGNKAYIGMRASIISKNADNTRNGVCIGEKAIIGACTLVNRDIPAGAKAVGVPCRLIG